MRKRYIQLSVLVVAAITCATAFSSCKKQHEDPLEVTRTYEFIDVTTFNPETTSQKGTETTEAQFTAEPTSSHPTEKDTTSATESTTEELTGARKYFFNPDSVFSTLPEFNAGDFVEKYDTQYLEVLRFVGVTESEYEAYVELVKAGEKYKFNSKDVNRTYFADGDGMCLTVIINEDTMLVELGKNYWDSETFKVVEELPTKPSEQTDSRYSYFDNKNLVFNSVPYFTYGDFIEYSAIDDGGIMKFKNVTKEQFDAYAEVLLANFFLFEGFPSDGSRSYSGNGVYLNMLLEGDVLTLTVEEYLMLY